MAFETLSKSLDEINKGLLKSQRIKETTVTEKSISTLWPVHKKLVLVGCEDSSIMILRNDLQLVREFQTTIGRIERFIRISQEVYGFGSLPCCIKFNAQYTSIEEKELPFIISLSDYSVTSKKVVFFINESQKLLFKNLEKDQSPFEDLSEISIMKKVNHLRLSNVYLFLSTDGTVEKWNLNLKEPEIVIEEFNISALVCNSDSCYFLANSQLKLLKVNSEHKILKNEDLMPDTISCLKDGITSISLASKRFLYLLSSKDLSLYDIASRGFKYICSLKFDYPAGKVIADSNYLYTFSKNHIRRIQTQEDLLLEKLVEVSGNIIDYKHSFNDSLFVCTSENMVYKFAVDDGKLAYTECNKQIYPEDEITCLDFDPLIKEVAVGMKQTTIKVYNMDNLTQIRIIPFHRLPIIKVCYLKSVLVSVGHYEDQIEVHFESIKKTDQFRLTENQTLNKIFCTNNSESLYILQDTSIISYNSEGTKQIKKIPQITHAQYFKCDSQYLVLIDKIIEIREISSLEVVCSVPFENLLSGENIQAVGISSSYLLIATLTLIHCLSIENKTFIGSIDMKIKAQSISFYNNFILISIDKGIYRINNFLSGNSIKDSFIIGPKLPSLALICALETDLKTQEYPDHVYSWTLLPQCINVIHLFAYNSSREQMKKSFKFKSNILKSSTNISPLTISLEKRYKDISDYLIKKIARESKTRPYILSIIEQDLSDINKSHVGSISEIYRQAMSESEQFDLPRYIIPIDRETIALSKGFIINPGLFVDSTKGIDFESFVTFFNSNLRLHFATGSKGCVEFLSSLILCQDSQVFSTQIIKNYLNYKWTNASGYLRLHFFLFLVFLLLITIEDKFESYTWRFIVLITILILNSLSLFVEYLQITYNIRYYIRSKTNWIDLVRIFMTYSYVTMVMISEGSEESRKDQIGYSTIVIFASYLRGIMHFKMFKSTRYMTKMIEEIIKDSFFFALVLLYVLAAFTTFYHFARSGDSYTESIGVVYLIMYGEFGFNKSSLIEWICFYCISISLTLVMFNLLVAIMGGTYERVYDSMVENDFKAMTQLILESEIVMSAFTNPDNCQMYIHKCTVGNEIEQNSDESINSKIKLCINHLNDLRSKLKDITSESLLDSCSKYKNEKMEKLEQLKSTIERQKQEIQSKITAALTKPPEPHY